MAKKTIKYIYADIKFTIKEMHGRWYLDYYYAGIRQRGSTGVKATKQGLETVKKQIIPDIVRGLGKKAEILEILVDDKKEQTLDEFATEYFYLK